MMLLKLATAISLYHISDGIITAQRTGSQVGELVGRGIGIAFVIAQDLDLGIFTTGSFHHNSFTGNRQNSMLWTTGCGAGIRLPAIAAGNSIPRCAIRCVAISRRFQQIIEPR